MDPLTILMWIGIVVGGCIALYIVLQLLVFLFALGMIGVSFVLGLFGIVSSSRKAKKTRARVGRRGF